MNDFMDRIDRLANLVPGGQLASVMGPEKFMDHVIEYVEELQKKLVLPHGDGSHWIHCVTCSTARTRFLEWLRGELGLPETAKEAEFRSAIELLVCAADPADQDVTNKSADKWRVGDLALSRHGDGLWLPMIVSSVRSLRFIVMSELQYDIGFCGETKRASADEIVRAIKSTL